MRNCAFALNCDVFGTLQCCIYQGTSISQSVCSNIICTVKTLSSFTFMSFQHPQVIPATIIQSNKPIVVTSCKIDSQNTRYVQLLSRCLLSGPLPYRSINEVHSYQCSLLVKPFPAFMVKSLQLPIGVWRNIRICTGSQGSAVPRVSTT